MKDLGLYVHIPFCEQKCHYCAFASRAGATAEIIDDYTEAVVKEIRGWEGKIKKVKSLKDSGDGSCRLTNPVLSVRTAKIYQDKRTVPLPQKTKVRTVYFGGGTPSYISEENIGRIMVTLGDVFGFDPQDPALEKTIEVNPGSASEKKLAAYHQMGFNRLSIGLQAAQNRLLKSMGRIHRAEDFSGTVRCAAEVGFENISSDLIFGLPRQSCADVEDSIQFLLSFPNIRHISCYSLSIEQGTVFEQMFRSGKLILPDEETERSMYEIIRTKLAVQGMQQYEISNFAFPGFESRHNSSYWNLTPYLGFGSAAASFYKGERWTNLSNAEDYCSAIKENRSAQQESHRLSETEIRGDFMFLGLRRIEGVCDREYQRMFNGSFFEDYSEAIQKLLRQGLIHRDNDRIFLTRRGLDLANQVFMAFV